MGEKEKKVCKDLLRLENGNDSRPSLMVNAARSERPKICRPPVSAALAQVKNFMPKLKEANEELNKMIQQSSSESVNIENVDGCKGSIVEMNLALVEFDGSSEDERNTSSGDSDSDSDCSNEVTAKNMKLPDVKQCKKENMIEEIQKHQEKG